MERYRNLYCILAISLLSVISYGLSGSGTSDDPYLIQSMDDFDEFRNDSTFWTKHIRLECELDLTGRTFYAACIEYFRGVFDGNHQPIRNLRIDGGGVRDYMGFIGSAYSAQIRNMNFIAPNVSGDEYVGVLCGYSQASGITDCDVVDMTAMAYKYGGGIVGYDSGSSISNCVISGQITGYQTASYLGGLIGYCYDFTIVESCHATVTIKPSPAYTVSSIGGLIGMLGQGQISRSSSNSTLNGKNSVGGLLGISIRPTNVVEDCFSEGTISGTDSIGGLIGQNGNSTASNNAGGTVRRCSSKSTVNSSGRFGGGLIGQNFAGPVYQCSSYSTVSGGSFIGGLIGTSNGSIQDCYATGTVDCSSMYFGGLIGTTGATIARCYAAVVLSGSTTVRGGLFGTLETAGKASSCFWDSQIQTATGIQSIGDKKGTATDVYSKTTPEMMTQSTFTAYGWDFTNETTNGIADLWRLCTDGTNYPHLSWEFPRQDLACPDGVGIEDLLIFSAQWLTTGLSPSTGSDFTGDGNITLEDLAIFSSVWLKNL